MARLIGKCKSSGPSGAGLILTVLDSRDPDDVPGLKGTWAFASAAAAAARAPRSSGVAECLLSEIDSRPWDRRNPAPERRDRSRIVQSRGKPTIAATPRASGAQRPL